MGRQPEATGLRDLKRESVEKGEPLNSQDRRVQQIGSSLYVNLTKYSRDTHAINSGDELTVQTFPAGIWIGVNDD